MPTNGCFHCCYINGGLWPLTPYRKTSIAVCSEHKTNVCIWLRSSICNNPHVNNWTPILQYQDRSCAELVPWAWVSLERLKWLTKRCLYLPARLYSTKDTIDVYIKRTLSCTVPFSGGVTIRHCKSAILLVLLHFITCNSWSEHHMKTKSTSNCRILLPDVPFHKNDMCKHQPMKILNGNAMCGCNFVVQKYIMALTMHEGSERMLDNFVSSRRNR